MDPYLCLRPSFSPKGKHLSSEEDLVLHLDKNKKDCAVYNERNAFLSKSLKFPFPGKGET